MSTDAAGNRAAALTRQLLAFSRQQILRLEPVDVAAAARAVEKMLRRLMGEDVRLVTRYAPGLPPVIADRTQLDQVLLNLAVNARDAMPTGGAITLTVSETRIGPWSREAATDLEPGRYVRLDVADTGCGMDAETADRAFEPFFTTKPEGRGTGLRLSTVYGIVKQLGGRISVSSEPGSGTCFTVLLPGGQGSSPDREQSRPAPVTKGRILLEEDDASVRASIARMLRRLGCSVLAASGPAAGRRILRESDEHVSLILCDVVMPGTSGPQLIRGLREEGVETPVVFMSGYAGDVTARHGIEELGAAVLAKPFTPKELAEAVRLALSG